MRPAIAAIAVLGIVACAPRQDAPILVETPGRSGVVMPTTDLSLEDAVARAVADLARRVGGTESAIEVIRAGAVDWPSSALGCPQPDRMYATVLTPGYEIVLEVHGGEYHYHAGRRGEPFLCPRERLESPAATRY